MSATTSTTTTRTKINKNTTYFNNNIRDESYIEIDQTLIRSRILKAVELVTTDFKPQDQDGGEGLYGGTAGIAYMFYHLVKSGNFPTKEREFLELASEYIKPAIEYYDNKVSSEKKESVGFLIGAGGVYAVAAMIYMKLGDTKYADYLGKYARLANTCETTDFLENGSDEMFAGRAGYIMGALLLRREIKREVVPPQQMVKLCQTTIESGRKFRERIQINVDIPLMYEYHGTTYLGAAHGISGIFQSLLSVPKFVRSDKEGVEKIFKSIDFLTRHCLIDGNIASHFKGALVASSRQSFVHWCHGASGLIYMFARAYLVTGEERYFHVCRDMAELVWKEGLVTKGPGLCFGIAGTGYVHLLMYRLKLDKKYLHRAKVFGDFMFTEQFEKESDVPDRPYSLFEGWAGAVCFLNDLLKPSKSEFPLLNVNL